MSADIGRLAATKAIDVSAGFGGLNGKSEARIGRYEMEVA